MLEISLLDNYLMTCTRQHLSYVISTDIIVHFLRFSPCLKLRFADLLLNKYVCICMYYNFISNEKRYCILVCQKFSVSTKYIGLVIYC